MQMLNAAVHVLKLLNVMHVFK